MRLVPSAARLATGGFALVTLGVLVPVGRGQEVVTNRYDAMWGRATDASVTDLVENPSSYEGRAVRTHGRVEMLGMSQTYSLRDNFNSSVRIVPVPEISSEFEQEAPRFFGREVEVTGVFQRGTSLASTTGAWTITFWRYLGPPPPETKEARATLLRLETLVINPGKHDGQHVRVVGKFRGHNLYGDLPAKSQRNRADWVIKDELFAVWVTGKKPKGTGWNLDPDLKRDTGKWIEVLGRPETVGGIAYIKAAEVVLGTPPTPTAQALPPPQKVEERPKVPPVVVFALPLDGDREVPPDTRFQVQFSKDMDEKSFEHRVILRYAGPRLPGDRALDGVRVSYEGGRRVLIVDPGSLLRAGRQVELILLPGIVDTDGLPLTSRSGRPMSDAADVLRFQVGRGSTVSAR